MGKDCIYWNVYQYLGLKDLCIFWKGNLCGIMNSNKDILLENKYTSIYIKNNLLYLKKIDNLYEIRDLNLNLLN